MKILITGGCTSEKIDAARHITNKSSGTMGLLISQVARFRGAQVKYIHGPLKIDKDLKERQKLLEAYKIQIANLKKKLEDDLEDEDDDKTVE